MTSTFPVPLVPDNLARPPVFWSAAEVKAWVEFCVQEFSLSPITFDRFDMNGKALMLLNRSDFMERAPQSGDVLFNAFKHLTVNTVSGPNYMFHAQIKTPVRLASSSDPLAPSDSSLRLPSSPFVSILPHPGTPKSQGGEGPHRPDSSGIDSVPGCVLSPAATDKSLSDTESCHNYIDSPPKSRDSSSDGQTIGPTSVSGSSDGQPEADQTFTEQKGDCRLLWEFIYQLLMHESDQDLVYWESHKDLVFHINNPTGLAEQWGAQKNRTNMTYEKLSRALRYYYRMNIIQKVPGKKLTYRFLQSPSKIRKGQRGAKPHSSMGYSSDVGDTTLEIPSQISSTKKTSATNSSSDSPQPSPSVSSCPSQQSVTSKPGQQRNSPCNPDDRSRSNDVIADSCTRCGFRDKEIVRSLSQNSNEIKTEIVGKFESEFIFDNDNCPENLSLSRQTSHDQICPASRFSDESSGNEEHSKSTTNLSVKMDSESGPICLTKSCDEKRPSGNMVQTEPHKPQLSFLDDLCQTIGPPINATSPFSYRRSLSAGTCLNQNEDVMTLNSQSGISNLGMCDDRQASILHRQDNFVFTKHPSLENRPLPIGSYSSLPDGRHSFLTNHRTLDTDTTETSEHLRISSITNQSKSDNHNASSFATLTTVNCQIIPPFANQRAPENNLLEPNNISPIASQPNYQPFQTASDGGPLRIRMAHSHRTIPYLLPSPSYDPPHQSYSVPIPSHNAVHEPYSPYINTPMPPRDSSQGFNGRESIPYVPSEQNTNFDSDCSKLRQPPSIKPRNELGLDTYPTSGLTPLLAPSVFLSEDRMLSEKIGKSPNADTKPTPDHVPFLHANNISEFPNNSLHVSKDTSDFSDFPEDLSIKKDKSCESERHQMDQCKDIPTSTL